MDDQEFLDALYQLWAKTTGETWGAEELDGTWAIHARDESGSIGIADFLPEDDAKFIAFVHSVLPEIVRRLQDALDEADRLDAEKDELIAINYGLEMDLQAMREAV